MQSRLLAINFDIAPGDRHGVQRRLLQRYCKVLLEMNVADADSRLREIIAIYFPDLRAIANRIEWEYADLVT